MPILSSPYPEFAHLWNDKYVRAFFQKKLYACLGKREKIALTYLPLYFVNIGFLLHSNVDVFYRYTGRRNMYQEILDFWFNEISPSQWWSQDYDFDLKIRNRFLEVHAKAVRCELYEWREVPEGRLAEIIVLDQFSRNMFRDLLLSYAYDSLALALAQAAISVKADEKLSTPEQRSFLYIPFMHSESLEIHKLALNLYEKNGIKENTSAEKQHKKIIEKFGRYPHRNKILGRASTKEEFEFLNQKKYNFYETLKLHREV